MLAVSKLGLLQCDIQDLIDKELSKNFSDIFSHVMIFPSNVYIAIGYNHSEVDYGHIGDINLYF